MGFFFLYRLWDLLKSRKKQNPINDGNPPFTIIVSSVVAERKISSARSEQTLVFHLRQIRMRQTTVNCKHTNGK